MIGCMIDVMLMFGVIDFLGCFKILLSVGIWELWVDGLMLLLVWL